MTHPDPPDAPAVDMADIIAAGNAAAAELARQLADAPAVDLSDIIAAGEAAAADLVRIAGEDVDLSDVIAAGAEAPDAATAEAELYAAVLRLAVDHPVYVPPAPAARRPGPAGELDPVDSLATAADVLRAYLDADPAEPVSTARAYEALAVVERLAAAGDNLLPPAAVAARLGVSVDTVRRLISEGQLPAVRLGYRTMRVPVEGLAAYRAQLAKGSGRSNRSKIGGQRPGMAENQAASTTP